MHHLFIIDPFAELRHERDTSVAMMNSALAKGHRVSVARLEDLVISRGRLVVDSKDVSGSADGLSIGSDRSEIDLGKRSADVVWMRKDPPVDEAYVRACHLLRGSSVRVINDPSTLTSCDEKLFCLEFDKFIPQTWVGQSVAFLREVIGSLGKVALKPIGRRGGEGVVILESGDRNINPILEIATEHGQRKVLVQEYLPAVAEGDKRVFLLDGEVLGAILRVPGITDHRGNLAAGARGLKTSPTSRELEICRAVSPRLKALGIVLAGVDFIGERLTEINITSPTGLVEIGKLEGVNLADRVIAWAERNIAVA